jgi:aromatic-L-amino-acid decarboxylase
MFASHLKEEILKESDFEVLAPVIINVVCFRYKPAGIDEMMLNAINEKLNHTLNDSGKIYLSHTILSGKYTLRMVTGQTNVTLDHVEKAWALIKKTARAVAT